MNKINIQVATSNCPDLGAPRVARFTDLSIHANGSIHANYAIDVLSLDKSKVMIADQERGTVAYNPFPVNHGDEVVEDVMTPELEALVTAIKPKLTNILKTINNEEEEE